MCLSRTARRARALVLFPIVQLTLLKLCLICHITESTSDTKALRHLDPSYRPPPIWGCEKGLPLGSFHIVVATYAPEPSALIPWIWNLGLTGAHIYIYHRLPSSDSRLLSAISILSAFEPYPCNSQVTLQPLLPNKGREAAVYLTHIVTHFDNLPAGLALVHDHGPAARHSLCGPFFRRLRGYYAGIREQRRRGGGGGRSGEGHVSEGYASGVGSNDNGTVMEEAGVEEQQPRQQRRLLADAVVDAATGDGGGGGIGRGTMVAGSGNYRRKASYSRTTESGAVRRMLARFASRVVSLSSGCQENWLKGCCAMLLCAEDGAETDPSTGTAEDGIAWLSGGVATDGGGRTWGVGNVTGGSVTLNGGGTEETSNRGTGSIHRQRHLITNGDMGGGVGAAAAGGGETEAARLAAARAARGRCPFKTSRCLANASMLSIPLRAGMARGGHRWVYMHGAGGLYDTRYENLVVLYNESPEAAAAALSTGVSNGGFGPLSLVRYAGADAVETARLATSASRSLDYPATGPGAPTRTPQETYTQLNRILAAHDFTNRRTPGTFKSCCASLLLRPSHIRRWPKSLYEQVLSYTLDEQNTYHASLAVSHHGWALWAGTDSGPDDLLRYFEVDLALLNVRGCPGWRMVVEPGE